MDKNEELMRNFIRNAGSETALMDSGVLVNNILTQKPVVNYAVDLIVGKKFKVVGMILTDTKCVELNIATTYQDKDKTGASNIKRFDLSPEYKGKPLEALLVPETISDVSVWIKAQLPHHLDGLVNDEEKLGWCFRQTFCGLYALALNILSVKPIEDIGIVYN